MAASPSAVLAAPVASSRQLWRFGLISGALLGLWIIGASYGLGTDSAFDALLCRQLAAGSAWFLRALGWQANVAAQAANLLLINGRACVIVGPPCDGLVLYALLAGFVLAYPGPAWRRLWFIPLGVAALWLLNVVRIVALALNHEYSPGTFDFNHHYAFSAVAYAALGGLWLLWTRQGSHPTANSSAGLPTSRQLLTEDEPAATASQPAATTRAPWLTVRVGAGLVLLAALALVNAYQDKVIGLLSTWWAGALATGPAWLHRLPGATAGAAPGSVSHLALPVGAAFMGFCLVSSLLVFWLVLPARGWRLAWRSYAGVVLLIVGLLLLGRAGVGPVAYRISRLLIDFLVSLLPVVGLLVLLWRRPAPAVVPAAAVAAPAVPAEAG